MGCALAGMQECSAGILETTVLRIHSVMTEYKRGGILLGSLDACLIRVSYTLNMISHK